MRLRAWSTSEVTVTVITSAVGMSVNSGFLPPRHSHTEIESSDSEARSWFDVPNSVQNRP